MRRASGGVVALSLALAGCGTAVVIPSGAEHAITRLVRSKTGLPTSQVTCPAGIQAKVGNTFDCHFTAQGQRYVAHMHITKVAGTSVYYEVTTARS